MIAIHHRSPGEPNQQQSHSHIHHVPHFVAELEQKHGRALHRFLAARMRHTQADVPDLVQEVFLRLLRHSNHELIRNPQAYLYTVASHVLYQYTLRQRPTPSPAEQPDLTADPDEPTSCDPAEQIELEQRFEILGRDLERYSPPHTQHSSSAAATAQPSSKSPSTWA